MIIKYSYLKKDYTECGPYSCDREDFIKLFKNKIFQNDLECLYCIANKKLYIYTKSQNKLAGGWQFVKNI